MIHELREYWLSRENWGKYFPLLKQVGMPIRTDAFGALVGGWTAQPEESGLVHFIHIWAYESLDRRAHLRAELIKDKKWTSSFLPTASRLVHRQQISFLNPITFVQEKIPVNPILTRFDCVPGTRPELIGVAKQIDLNCWATEAPNPNEMVLMSSSDPLATDRFISTNGGVSHASTQMYKVDL